MTEQTAAAGHKVGKPMLHNWVEERAIADLHTEDPKTHKHIHGHKGILTIDLESKMESMTTLKAAYVAPKSPVGRLQGIRGELLKKHTAQMISEKIYADLNPLTPKTEYCTTTQKDFCVEGFVPHKPETTRVHDYKTDQAITFWSENCQRIQGVTAARSSKGPFRKLALFSTPITERLDEIDLPPDN
ncbi:sperm-associated antigen 8 isoform X1 [Neolamprologus brichardi]|uniref:sperm-associated antigen 8 isoform X1 n=2 Tax=Neolamprologus brichardi TaxID=32507 RepID=UPI0003EC2508|nr:sperm-associated antigen 8 isoform X1 [Neolamprologus brichardi]